MTDDQRSKLEERLWQIHSMAKALDLGRGNSMDDIQALKELEDSYHVSNLSKVMSDLVHDVLNYLDSTRGKGGSRDATLDK